MNGSTLRKRASGMAMAIAIATGAMITTSAIVAEPAYAQKKKKKKKEKAEYSKEFIAAYSPVNDAFNAENADTAALKPQLLAIVPLAKSPDEKNALGGLLYNASISLKDPAMQSQGMEMMLSSGKVAPERIAGFNFIAFQLRYAAEDFAGAQPFLQAAMDNNYTNERYNADDLKLLMFETKVSDGKLVDAIGYVEAQAASKKAAGGTVPEIWYRRAVSEAYGAELGPQLYSIVQLWVADYPTTKNWTDAINLTRNLNEYESPEMLDLMRLASTVGTITDLNDVSLYVESADPRRLPLEVKNLIEKAYADGTVSRDDIYLADSLTTANQRIPADRSELPEIEAEADATTGDLKTVMAAGDVFYSYGEFAKAERFYSKALTMPGVDTALAQTRLGMSQIALGKYDDAKATLGKVQGNREPIAGLWATYAAEKQSPPAAIGG